MWSKNNVEAVWDLHQSAFHHNENFYIISMPREKVAFLDNRREKTFLKHVMQNVTLRHKLKTFHRNRNIEINKSFNAIKLRDSHS